MSVAAVFKDLTKVELVGILSDLVFDDELFARMTVASYRRRAAVEERAAISKRQSMALDRDLLPDAEPEFKPWPRRT